MSDFYALLIFLGWWVGEYSQRHDFDEKWHIFGNMIIFYLSNAIVYVFLYILCIFLFFVML